MSKINMYIKLYTYFHNYSKKSSLFLKIRTSFRKIKLCQPLDKYAIHVHGGLHTSAGVQKEHQH